MQACGLFDRVAPGDIKAGDYGYRHWSARTIERRVVGDIGDAFIVTKSSKNSLSAANDHLFQVPPAGKHYAPGIIFLRPNAKFYQAYEHYKETGQMTKLTMQNSQTQG